MASRRSSVLELAPLSEQLPALLADQAQRGPARRQSNAARSKPSRPASLRQLARALEISAGHLSRVVNGEKSYDAGLLERLAAELGVKPSRFPEYRELIALEAVRRNPQLRDEIFSALSPSQRKAPPRSVIRPRAGKS